MATSASSSHKLVLEGKVAFITGAASSRGMGRAVANRLAREGADIVVNDKFAAPKSNWPGDENWKGLEDVVTEIEALGRKAMAVVGAVDDGAAIEKAVQAAVKAFGHIDILVNCAGVRGAVGVPVVEGDEAEWRQTFDVNTFGAFFVSRAVAKEMIRRGQGGRMIHIASVAGREGVPGSAAYAASKWALIGLVQTLAKELAPHRINVNAINPGFFSTNLRDSEAAERAQKKGISLQELREQEYKHLSSLVPLGRMGKVSDIAGVVFFLVSPESEYMTGQDINVTGGVKMP
jgi:NAD(P)-dependent dehydrogenase (short-subunit alcohol dehydrogenase family)